MPDVFISYATEDTEKVARPLAEALRDNGVDVWFAEFSLNIGDNLRESVDNGIRTSKFGILILSKSFFKSQWTKKELDAFFAREITGQNCILPIWHELSFEDILDLAPTLANRFAIKTSDGMDQVINKILKVVKPDVFKKRTGIISQPLVNIEANKDSFLVGRSIIFSGQCINGGNIVRLTAIGPGEYIQGKEIGSPTVSSSGNWIFEWTPENSIEPGEYFMKVSDSMSRVSDELPFRIEKGAVTMVAAGSQVYYIGDKVRISGTATIPTKEVYLSVIRHGLFSKQKKIDELNVVSTDNDQDSFTKVGVEKECTWSFTWDTSLVASELKKGQYTIYATESPLTLGSLNKKAFSSCSIIIEQPFVRVSATASQSTVAQGDLLYITGTAEGKPRKGMQIWIFGKEISLLKQVIVNPDASYVLKLLREETKKFPPGQYFVVVQHPMMNNAFDVYLDTDRKTVLSNYPNNGTALFSLDGPLKKTGVDAAEALVQAINNPGIDDTYTKLQFLIEKPVVRFDPINNKRKGDKFTITAQTNLAVDDEIMMTLYPSDNSDQKALTRAFCGGKGTIMVVKGDSGMNKIAFDVDTLTFEPDEYIVKASAMLLDVVEEIKFRIN